MTARRPHRAGWSLVEVVLIMGGLAILLGLGAATLQLALRAERRGRAALADADSVARLARQLRRDAHAAASAESPGDRLVLDLPGGRRVEYRAEGERLLRIEGSDRRESFALPGGVAPRFEVSGGGDGSSRLVTLIYADEPPVGSPLRGARVEAALGLDRRFADAGEDAP